MTTLTDRVVTVEKKLKALTEERMALFDESSRSNSRIAELDAERATLERTLDDLRVLVDATTRSPGHAVASELITRCHELHTLSSGMIQLTFERDHLVRLVNDIVSHELASALSGIQARIDAVSSAPAH